MHLPELDVGGPELHEPFSTAHGVFVPFRNHLPWHVIVRIGEDGEVTLLPREIPETVAGEEANDGR